MTTQEIIAAESAIATATTAEINKAANALWSRYLKTPCSFKDKDFSKAAFAAFFNNSSVASQLEREGYSLRLIINTIARESRGLVMGWIKAKKSPMN